MRKSVFATNVLIAALAVGLAEPSQAQDRGLTARPDALGGTPWQARFERDLTSPMPSPMLLALGQPATQVQSLRLLGDYQFSALRLGDTGGLRLTGGVLIQLKPSPGALPEAGNGALPYAGIGYTSASLRGEWGFSADLGLAAPGLSSARMDRLFNNGLGLTTDMAPRLLPMVRLGMNVAF